MTGIPSSSLAGGVIHRLAFRLICGDVTPCGITRIQWGWNTSTTVATHGGAQSHTTATARECDASADIAERRTRAHAAPACPSSVPLRSALSGASTLAGHYVRTVGSVSGAARIAIARILWPIC